MVEGIDTNDKNPWENHAVKDSPLSLKVHGLLNTTPESHTFNVVFKSHTQQLDPNRNAIFIVFCLSVSVIISLMVFP